MHNVSVVDWDGPVVKMLKADLGSELRPENLFHRVFIKSPLEVLRKIFTHQIMYLC